MVYYLQDYTYIDAHRLYRINNDAYNDDIMGRGFHLEDYLLLFRSIAISAFEDEINSKDEYNLTTRNGNKKINKRKLNSVISKFSLKVFIKNFL